MTETEPLTVAGELNTGLIRTNLDEVVGHRLWTAQRPYRNGVTVYAYSMWGGNGFGTDVARVAVRDGMVVAVYEGGQFHQIARVVGVGDIGNDYDRYANGERYVTRKAFSKWVEAVKAL